MSTSNTPAPVRAVLVTVGLRQAVSPDDAAEFEALARSAGVLPVAILETRRDRPDSRLFVGSGKAAEVAAAVAAHEAELVLVDQPLSASQERNLERAVCARVLDRNGLILDIFAQRARSFEGKLQVELAQLERLSTRLVRGWTHLERQKGGIGLRGPGETQLETDRRLIGERIRQLKRRLERVDRQRVQSRSLRKRTAVPTVSLVGYTNAGKSTLFNRLTGAGAFAADQLFATLDPTVRRLELAPHRQAVLADTVGFVQDLPHELVVAFRSTLVETREADLLLHVIDASDPHRAERIRQVEQVLSDVGADGVPVLQVFNKIDILGDCARHEAGGEGCEGRVWLSAVTGEGLDGLLTAIRQVLDGEMVAGTLRLEADQGRLRSRLFELDAVRQERTTDEGGWLLDVEMSDSRFRQLCRREGMVPELLESQLDSCA
ncbi:MAG: GTPase HflX [Gammaproteobacteria bacterium]|nr:MAG: GTPase HflX [Gammaproteobacteria bacterium]